MRFLFSLIAFTLVGSAHAQTQHKEVIVQLTSPPSEYVVEMACGKDIGVKIVVDGDFSKDGVVRGTNIIFNDCRADWKLVRAGVIKNTESDRTQTEYYFEGQSDCEITINGKPKSFGQRAKIYMGNNCTNGI